MVPFSCWVIPVQYAGIKAENNATREKAGASIYFTTDGSTPSTTSNLYSGASTYATGISYCNILSLVGKTWRLSNVNE